MDVFRLDPNTYVPTDMVENYSSAIWTERYSELGEFEIRSPNIDTMAGLLPLEALLSHRETQEVMIVDTHSIEEDEDGTAELVIRGTSFEAVLQDRVIEGTHKQVYRTPYDYTPCQATSMLAFNVLCNPHGQDLTKSTSYGMAPANNLPNFGVGTYDYYSQGLRDWWLEPGDVYETIKDWMVRANLGVRGARPSTSFVVDPLGFTPLVYDAAALPSVDPATDKMRLIFWTGIDRSVGNPQGLTPVRFQYRENHLENPKYLFSSKGLKTACTVTSSIGSVTAYSDDYVAPYLTGRQRRFMMIDGGDPGDMEQTAFIGSMVQKGEIELAKHRRTQLFDAQITPITNYKYGWHYDLGDLVMMEGQYGFSQKMQVIEHTRTEDEEGDRGYPALIVAP